MHDRVLEVAKSLRAGSLEGSWLLTEPHLLYLSESQSRAYLQAMENDQYSSGFHSATVETIARNVSEMVDPVLHRKLALIDLGPGYPDKAIPIGKFCNANKIPLHYVPVDISSEFLTIAARAMARFSHNISPIHSKFEACGSQLQEIGLNDECLVMIGLTFMNFEPGVILPLLRRIGPKGARFLVAAELVTPENTVERILNQYRVDEARDFAFGPLSVVGIEPAFIDFDVRFVNDRVEFVFTLKSNIPKILFDRGLRVGHRITTAVSYRYTRAQLSNVFKIYDFSSRIFFSIDERSAVAVLSSVI
jgi:hypothetical protein